MHDRNVIAKNWRELISPARSRREESHATLRQVLRRAVRARLRPTLGNALRRVLLSSLQGAAITSVRINGVLHEFSTIPGVTEDVADIVLNLKEVRLACTARPRTCACTDGRRASHAPATSSRRSDDRDPEPRPRTSRRSPADADIELELTVAGRATCRAEHNKREEMPVGTIPIDAIFSPVRKVNYT